MRRKKIYLDTSVISYLRQEDAPQRMRDTREFWEILKAGKYEVYISEVVYAELAACPEPKRTRLLELLGEIDYTEISVEGNVKTIDGVRIVCVANDVRPIDIYTPAVLLERSEPDDSDSF